MPAGTTPFFLKTILLGGTTSMEAKVKALSPQITGLLIRLHSLRTCDALVPTAFQHDPGMGPDVLK